MPKKKIIITRQLEKTQHTFLIENPEKLAPEVVQRICDTMNVTSIFVSGKMYRNQYYN
jgi:hypothetical protein